MIAAIFIIGFFLIGLLLWVSSVKIAKIIIPKDVSVENVPLNDFHRPIYLLAFVLFGMYVLIYGLSDFSYTAQLYFSLPDEYMTPAQVEKQQAATISSAIEVVFGLVLIIGARGVSEVIHKIRYEAQRVRLITQRPRPPRQNRAVGLNRWTSPDLIASYNLRK